MTQNLSPTAPIDFLIEAEKIAYNAWEADIAKCTSSPDDAKMMIAALKHPFLRHLMELYLNDSATGLGAKILLRLKYAKVNRVNVQTEWCQGLTLYAIDLTEAGQRQVEALRQLWQGAGWFDYLTHGIMDYCCRDSGEGLCLGSQHLITAIENRDMAILQRLVEPDELEYQFGDLGEFTPYPESARLATAQSWAPRGIGRRAARLYTPSFEPQRPTWSLKDEVASFGAEFQDFSPEDDWELDERNAP